MKVIQTELKTYNRRADDSVSLRLDSLLELTSDDIAEIDRLRGNVAVAVVTDTIVGNEIDIKIDEILENLPKNDILNTYKSPSQRLRGALWLNSKQDLKRKPTKEEFAEYYDREMDKIIKHYTDKLDE